MSLFIGWLLGIIVGFVLGGALPDSSVFIAIAVFYIVGYAIATISVRSSLPAFTPPLTAALFPTDGSFALPQRPGEAFARALMIGGTAALNGVLLGGVAVVGWMLAGWAFFVISLAAVPTVSRNRIYQGVLGWSAWLFPVSYLATALGALLFIINLPIALVRGGFGALRLDWTTGAIETAGGLVGMPLLNGGFTGGFSLGNFNFLTSTALQDSFTAPGLSSHETGHTLNTAALGGFVLWINAVDENIPPFAKLNVAYGELAAESRAQGFSARGTRARYFVNLWA